MKEQPIKTKSVWQPTHTLKEARMRAHRLFACVGTLAVISLALGAAGASADPPISQPWPTPSQVFDVGTVPCGPIRLDSTADETLRIYFGHDGQPRFGIITGAARAVVTQLVTGKTVSLNIPGPAKFTPSGTTLYGAALIIGPNELWLTHGQVTFTGGFDPSSVIGNVVDLCPLLI